MNAVLEKILNMSAAGSVLILAVVIFRLILIRMRVPRWIVCALWGLVAFRLVCPVSLVSPVSVFRAVPHMVSGGGEVEVFHLEEGGGEPAQALWNNEAPETGPGMSSGSEGDSPAPAERSGGRTSSAFSLIYLAGLGAMLLYMGISTWMIGRKVSVSLRQRGNVRICDELDAPFIMGILRPVIYLPSSLSREERRYVLAHERAHLRRRDHIRKPLGFLILSLHWFNPFCWLAFVLFGRDIEFACDESVIRTFGRSERAAYSQTLLNVSSHRILAACPVAFGESDVKSRVKSILKYRRPALRVTVLALIACVVLTACFGADPLPGETEAAAGQEASSGAGAGGAQEFSSVTPDSSESSAGTDGSGNLHESSEGTADPQESSAAADDKTADSSPQPVRISAGGLTVEPGLFLLYEMKWKGNDWSFEDGPALEAQINELEKLPVLTSTDGFSVDFGGYVRKSGLQIYDDSFELIRDSWYGDTALNWLTPGSYFGVLEVYGPLGRYIASQDSYEENVYSCVFRISVSNEGTAPYTPEKISDLTEARLSLMGEEYVLNDEAGLLRLEEWLKNAEVLPGGAGCPFGSLLTLTCADGSIYSCCPAEDSCGVVFSDGVYYRYASDNEEFLALFGARYPWMEG